tara:strand:- start:127 stop:1200 length:1074 start_codon:yes stop_codon:yes gene_type:complete
MDAASLRKPASWLLLSSETSTPGPDSFKSHVVGDVEAGLHLAASHLRGRSCRAHKSRVDLDALAALTGERIHSVELVPDELHARWRDTHELIAIELLPARVGLGSSVGEDAVILLMDAHGAAKGLPHNELASRVCGACGLKALTCRGDAFLCRLREDDGALLLGGDATPEMMGESDWLAKAQKCASLAHGAGVRSPLQEALTIQLAAAAAKVAATADAAAAAAAAASSVAVDEAAAALGVLGWENGGDAESEDAHVLVRVAVPPETRAKHVKCEVKPEWLRLEVSTLHAAPLLVDGQLFYPVKPAECTWALEDAKGGGGRWLTLSLEKAHQNMRWLDLTRKAGVTYHNSGDKDTEQE